MKRVGIILAGLVLVALTLFAFRGPLAMALMGAAVDRLMTADPLAELEPGIHVTLCGAGSPLPDPIRSGPCLSLVAGGKLFIVDAGSGGTRNVNAQGTPVGSVEAVFLTHFHSDHIDGLGELATLRWAGSGGAWSEPLPVYGPPGVERVAAGFNDAYALDVGYRVAHHGEKVVPPSAAGLKAMPFAAPRPGAEVVVYDEGGVKVRAFAVDHTPISPAVGYRFDHAGRSVVISGDTVKSAEIARMAKDADLLVHEALASHMVEIMEKAAADAGLEARAKIMHDILDYHTTPAQAAETANEAGVGHLLLHHIVPPLIVPGMEAAFVRGVSEAWSGAVTVGRDGTRVSLPANSDAIQVSGG